MDRSKNKGWNREMLGQRQNTMSDSPEGKKLTDAEYHLTVGRIVSSRVCRGLDIEGYADRVNMTVEECRLALAYASSSPGMIFRALVEDWTWQRIQAELVQTKNGSEQNASIKSKDRRVDPGRTGCYNHRPDIVQIASCTSH